MAVISRLSDLSVQDRNVCDDLLATLIERNYPLDPPSMESLRAELWRKIFAGKWNTQQPNPAPSTLRKRDNDESGLYIGTLNQDVPIKGKGRGSVPIHRRAGQPVMYKVSFQFNGDVHFTWIDQNGQPILPAFVDHDGGLSLQDVQDTVAQHYDANEFERVGSWNWDKVVHWGRARLAVLASRYQGVGVIGQRQMPKPQEDLTELQQIRTVEDWQRRMEEGEGEHARPGPETAFKLDKLGRIIG
ncbi:hypothetical protein CSOJ01_02656 [Colletotrichum sojae]|uniref:Uncharacterized protein n=1 Tax=Colletotrichum sojae TaxID=2175907 RepID=A0A8H6JPH4_9PEZI|nr:hypothetical protein CSOJ01_02656 [Colletotrichum sojae]